MLLAFCVPSTSARSALMLPLVRGSMVSAAPGFLRYLNLLIPCVVLMSTPITLYGAAAHLLANAMLAESGSEPFTFTGWLLVAAPFAISSTLITAWLVLRLHLPPDAAISLTKPANATTTWSRSEILTLIVLVGLFLAVFTSHWHGWAFSTSLMLAALLLVMPGLGVLDWGDTLRRAPWDLLFFAGSAVWLTQALVQSGTGAWLVDQFLDPVSLSRLPPVLVVLMVGVVTITAHLYLPSHTARVAVLLPPLLVLSQQLGWNPALITLLAVLGIDYCLTFPVSSKAILLFDLDQQQTAKLVRLSLLLMPLYCLLMVIFYMLWWHPLGLTL
jgi:di/tricarboxylate transporter